MAVPWMKIEPYQDPDLPDGQSYPDSAFQAVFAGQVNIPPFQEWAKLRWGFNAAALLDEALDRQRTFLESQYTYPDELGMEAADRRTLAFRFIKRPDEPFLISIVAKVHGRTQAEVEESASSYFHQLQATIPHDYTLVPAATGVEFMRISGGYILDQGNTPLCMAQIKRTELSPDLKRRAPFLQGMWRSLPHAHEPVWRALAECVSPLLLNISLRSTVLYETEYEYLWTSTREVSQKDDKHSDPLTDSAWKRWSKQTIERRLSPWKKHFYLQVHLASPHKLSEHLIRTIGTSLTLNQQSETLSGHEVVFPAPGEIANWQTKLKNLDIIFSNSYLPAPRLSEVADLEEVFDVMRLPYPLPETNL